MMKFKLALLGLVVAATGCATSGFGSLYMNTVTRASFERPEVRSDVHDMTVVGPAQGESCSTDILGLIATGEAGYGAAYADALRHSGGGTMLFDVKADHHFMQILGLYSQSCTQITGIAVK